MTFPGGMFDPGRDPASLDAGVKAKTSELKRQAVRGERNIRHGSASMRPSLWQRLLVWLILAAFALWIGAFAYHAFTDDGPPEEPPVTNQP